jgi:hypothetical protein
MSQQQRYDVSPKWAIIFGLGALGFVASVIWLVTSLT